MMTTTSSKSTQYKEKAKVKSACAVDPDEQPSSSDQLALRGVHDRRRGRHSGSRRRSGTCGESELNAAEQLEEGASPRMTGMQHLPVPGIAHTVASHSGGEPDYLRLLPYELWLVIFNHVRRIPAVPPVEQGHVPGGSDHVHDETQLMAAKHRVRQSLWAAHRSCRLFRTVTHVFLATAVLDSCPYLPLLLDTNLIGKYRAAAGSGHLHHGGDPLLPCPPAIPLILLQGPSPDPSSTPDSTTADTDPTHSLTTLCSTTTSSSSRAHRLAWSKSMARYLRQITHPRSSSLDDWLPATPTPPSVSKLPTFISTLISTSFSPIPPDKYTSDFTDWHAFPIGALTGAPSSSSVDAAAVAAARISATPALDSAMYDPNALHLEQLRDVFHREAGRRGKVVSRAWVEYMERKDRIAREVAASLVRLGAALGWRWSARAREVLDQVLWAGTGGERPAASSVGRKDEGEAGRMRVRRNKVWADMAAQDQDAREDEWESGGRKGKGKGARRASRGSGWARKSEASGSSHPSVAPVASGELLTANDAYTPDHASAQADFESAYPWLQPAHLLDLGAARDLVRDYRDAIDNHPLLSRALLAANFVDAPQEADTDALAARPSYSTTSPTYLARLMVMFAAFAPQEYRVLRFPASVARKAGGMRKRVHRIAEEVGGLATRSFGSGGARFLVVVRMGEEQDQEANGE